MNVIHSLSATIDTLVSTHDAVSCLERGGNLNTLKLYVGDVLCGTFRDAALASEDDDKLFVILSRLLVLIDMHNDLVYETFHASVQPLVRTLDTELRWFVCVTCDVLDATTFTLRASSMDDTCCSGTFKLKDGCYTLVSSTGPAGTKIENKTMGEANVISWMCAARD